MGTCPDCIAFSGGCCASIFAGGWKLLLLPSEVERISLLAGKDPAEFIDTSPMSLAQQKWYAAADADDDPVWVRLITAWDRPTGFVHHCPFLGVKGCSLPYPAKPFACRIYPLSFNLTTARIGLPEKTDCPVCQDRKSLAEVLEYFGDESGSLEATFKRFREEAISIIYMTEKVAAVSPSP
ncbi:MAG: hypothetical protein HYX91_04550 [Chloroflexi bacterium]|nr:hypothetical protein [Chloroflexota bacterium]